MFRGPGRLGVSGDRGLPVAWSDERNIRWKTPLPGPGTSSPIVWGDRVYVTCYSGYGESEQSAGRMADLARHLVCVERGTGRIVWQKDLPSSSAVHGHTGVLTLHGYASNTPAADESGVYVFYGSSGAAAYTHDGALRWQRSLGTGEHNWGTSASVVLFDGLAIIHADIEGQRLVALRKDTGEEAWSVPTGQADTWSTPCLAEANGRHELIFHHSQGRPAATMKSVNPRTGEALWECRVLRDYLCPSPIVVGDVCYTLGYQRSAAVRLGGQGDVTDTHVAWRGEEGTEICTPVYHDGHLYWAHQESGIAYCVDARTGGVVYRERMTPAPGRIYASGVLGDGKIYYVSRENGVYVVAAAPRYELLGHNTIASDTSVFNGTPAISGGRLFLRSRQFLYCIAGQ
jgi:hypothetical protein